MPRPAATPPGTSPDTPGAGAPAPGSLKALQGLALLLLMQSVGEAISHFGQLPIPGPVVGMVALLLVLQWEPARQAVAPAAAFLLTHLSLLFVPVGVGVMTHLDLLSAYGFRLVAVIVLSTWVGMAVTVWVLRAFRGGGSSPP